MFVIWKLVDNSESAPRRSFIAFTSYGESVIESRRKLYEYADGLGLSLSGLETELIGITESEGVVL